MADKNQLSGGMDTQKQKNIASRDDQSSEKQEKDIEDMNQEQEIGQKGGQARTQQGEGGLPSDGESGTFANDQQDIEE